MKKSKKLMNFVDAAEMLWILVANVSSGDWTKQNVEWQQAAVKWRNNYLKTLKELELK